MSIQQFSTNSPEFAQAAQARFVAVLTKSIIDLEDLAVEAAFLDERLVSDKIQESLSPLRAALAAAREGVRASA